MGVAYNQYVQALEEKVRELAGQLAEVERERDELYETLRIATPDVKQMAERLARWRKRVA